MNLNESNVVHIFLTLYGRNFKNSPYLLTWTFIGVASSFFSRLAFTGLSSFPSKQLDWSFSVLKTSATFFITFCPFGKIIPHTVNFSIWNPMKKLWLHIDVFSSYLFKVNTIMIDYSNSLIYFLPLLFTSNPLEEVPVFKKIRLNYAFELLKMKKMGEWNNDQKPSYSISRCPIYVIMLGWFVICFFCAYDIIGLSCIICKISCCQ